MLLFLVIGFILSDTVGVLGDWLPQGTSKSWFSLFDLIWLDDSPTTIEIERATTTSLLVLDPWWPEDSTPKWGLPVGATILLDCLLDPWWWNGCPSRWTFGIVIVGPLAKCCPKWITLCSNLSLPYSPVKRVALPLFVVGQWREVPVLPTYKNSKKGYHHYHIDYITMCVSHIYLLQ
jgi:hypothetical protein